MWQRRGGGAGGQNKKIRTIAPKLHEVPLVDLSNCKYEVLRIILQKKGWEESHSCRNCHLIWTGLLFSTLKTYLSLVDVHLHRFQAYFVGSII